MCWSDKLGMYCAVSSDDATADAVMTSTNGIDWTVRTTPAGNRWVNVCWNPGVQAFVAISYNGTSNQVMSSPDGITWTIQTTPEDNSWFTVSAGNY